MNILAPKSAIQQDGTILNSDVLSKAVDRLATDLKTSGVGRVAIESARADHIVISLCACEQAGIELLLLRKLPGDLRQLHTWEVGALVGNDLALEILGSNTRVPSGFAVLLTTSGTTGVPKVARHSIECLLGRIRQPEQRSTPPVWLLTYHPASFAGIQVILSSMRGGGTLLASDSQNLQNLTSTALNGGATHISGTPTFWRAFLMALGENASRLLLRHLTLGGESVDQPTLERLCTTFPNASITHIYASTEAGALFAVHDGRAGFPAKWLHEPVGGVELRVREGMLEVRSPRAMQGYLGNTERNPLNEDGWLMTGDLVDVCKDRVTFLGRMDSVINVGGAKVVPDEVEAVLLSVEGVVEAHVSGVPNPICGYVIAAELTLQPGLDQKLIRHSALAVARCKLEPHQVPRIITIVDTIAYSETGKKDRKT